MSIDSYTYVGRKSRGCFVAASVEGTSYTADNVAEFLRDGLAIERLRTEHVRTLTFGCVHERPQPTRRVDQGVLL